MIYKAKAKANFITVLQNCAQLRVQADKDSEGLPFYGFSTFSGFFFYIFSAKTRPYR
jgi:hypothetical protein